MNAIDTNVLVYAQDPRDPRKQAIAQNLMRDLRPPVLLWQVACEFVSATNKLKRRGISVVDAHEVIRDLQNLWTAVCPSWHVWDAARSLGKRFQLSHWDALLVGACVEAGTTVLYSEDLAKPVREIGKVKVINPFQTGNGP